jgi:diguanylate cyclase (GGDEF)-like protein
LKSLEERVQRNDLSRDDARREGAEILRQMRYGDNGYFWADKADGFNVFHGTTPEYESKNRMDLQDTNGKYLIREIIEKGRKPGGGYTDYWFPKEGTKEAFPKRGYSLEFKPWGWIIGTGNYIDDIQKVLDDQKKNNDMEFYLSLKYLIIFSITTLLLFIVMGLMMAQRITRPLTECVDMAKRIAAGDLETKINVNGNDEVGQLSEAMNSMMINLRNVVDLRRLAHTDTLTNTNNRGYFMELLEETLQSSINANSPLTLILFDLDHFKLVNDTYGHAVGDDVLRMVSNVVNSFGLRQSDFWGRLGGEEFAIVLTDTRICDSVTVVERLRRALSEPAFLNGNGCFHITASFGVAQSMLSDESLALLRRADNAMYKAKAEGRNRACFDSNGV